MNELTVGMNRRTWTALMDLLGILGDAEEPLPATAPNLVLPKPEFTVECALRLQSVIVDMLYPLNATRLGFIYVTKPEILAKVRILFRQTGELICNR